MTKRSVYNRASADELILIITRWMFDVALVAALAVLLVYLVGTQVTMDGSSMQPGIESGDTLLVNRLHGSLFAYRRYDIVAYKADNGKIHMKRLVGLPGETVEIRNGKLYINGSEEATEAYFSDISSAGLASEPITLGEDEYFVLGDYTEVSLDSRFSDVGNLTSGDMIGKVWFRLAPFRRLGKVS